MFEKFNDEIIIEFLMLDENITVITRNGRLDLCKIVYTETDVFNKYPNAFDKAAENGDIEIVKYLTRMGC